MYVVSGSGAPSGHMTHSNYSPSIAFPTLGQSTQPPHSYPGQSTQPPHSYPGQSTQPPHSYLGQSTQPPHSYGLQASAPVLIPQGKFAIASLTAVIYILCMWKGHCQGDCFPV